ncbi:YdcF family protein [bacterium]|nr:YdcF family protein [bacterium]
MPDGGGPRASSLLATQAVANGVPWENIGTTLGKSASTRDEAAAVRDYAESDGLKSIIVVTDPYHTRRTQYVFHSVFSGSGIRVMVRPVRAHWYQSATWFFSPRGWEVTLKEYLKLAATVLGIQGD